MIDADVTPTPVHVLTADKKALTVDFDAGVQWRGAQRGSMNGDPLIIGYELQDLGTKGKRLTVTMRRPVKVLQVMALPTEGRQGRRIFWDVAEAN